MKRNVSESSQLEKEMHRLNLPSALPVTSSSFSALSFWELHQKLAECYSADISNLGGSPHVPAHLPKESPVRLDLPPPARMDSPPSTQGLHLSMQLSDEFKDRPMFSRLITPHGGTPAVQMPHNVRTLLDEQEGSYREEEEDTVRQIDLKPHPCFKVVNKERNKSQKRAVSVDALGSAVSATKTKSDVQPREMGRRFQFFCGRRALHPGAPFRTGWNLAVALCVLHDLIFVPLEAFDPPRTALLISMEWVTQIFWNFDFIVSLRTGYYHKGALVLDSWRSAKHYMKTWMTFDILLISLDWAIVVIDGNSLRSSEDDQGLAQWSGALQLLRFLRLARMLRWVKLQRVNEVFQELLHSQAASLYYALCGSIARLLILNHFVSCAWFGVGRLGGSNGWLASRPEASLFYNYLDCLNWAFAQLSVGSSPILPTSELELAFCCIIAFRSLLTYSTLISTMTSLMTGLSKIKEDEATEFRMLRNYLQHNEIPKGLQQKIVRFLQNQYSLKQQAKSTKSRVPLLELLSPQLTGELHLERYRKDFCKITFLKNLLLLDDFQTVQVLQKVALTAVGDVMVAAKDVVFLGGSIGTAAYLPVSGAVTYYSGSSKDCVDGSVWLAEACLWTNWIYMGDLLAEDVSHLAVMDASQFCDCVCECITTQKAAQTYAKDFLKRLQRSEDFSDIVVIEEETPRRHSVLTNVLPEMLVNNRRCCFWPWSRASVLPASSSFDGVSAPSSPNGAPAARSSGLSSVRPSSLSAVSGSEN